MAEYWLELYWILTQTGPNSYRFVLEYLIACTEMRMNCNEIWIALREIFASNWTQLNRSESLHRFVLAFELDFSIFARTLVKFLINRTRFRIDSTGIWIDLCGNFEGNRVECGYDERTGREIRARYPVVREFLSNCTDCPQWNMFRTEIYWSCTHRRSTSQGDKE